MGVLDMKEDFVPFDLAKKLKEKGFNVPCIYAYCEKGGWNSYTQKHEPITHILRTDGNPFGAYYTGNNWNKEYKPNKNKIRCSAPTISQVLKWLREEKKIFVEIVITPMGLYKPMIYDIGGFKKPYRDISPLINFNEAALAGIEYCLDNLI